MSTHVPICAASPGGTVPPEDGGTTAPEKLRIDQPGVKRLRVSLNCTWSGGPTKLSLAKKGVAAAATCQDPGLTTASSCEVATKQGDDWRIEFATPLRPDCPLVATTFE